jgi:hypothetical protein
MSKENEEQPAPRKSIEVNQLEFDEGGNTVWIHSALGGTVMRIKCTGKVVVHKCLSSPISHSDIVVQGDIDFCLTKADSVR